MFTVLFVSGKISVDDKKRRVVMLPDYGVLLHLLKNHWFLMN